MIAEDAAFGAGRQQGLLKVKKFEEAIKGNYSKKELRKAMLEVQMDKHAMHQLKESTVGCRRSVQDSTKDVSAPWRIHRTLTKRLAKQYNVPVDHIQLAQASSNSDELARLGRSVGMDKGGPSA